MKLKRLKVLKLISFVALAAIVIYVFNKFHLSNYLSVDGFNKYHNKILSYEKSHVYLFIVIYVLSYILLIAACIPGTILFDLIAGFIFGIVDGSIIVIFSYALGAIVNFLLVKYLFRDILHRKFGHFDHLVLNNGHNKKAIMLNLIGLRCIPVIPFWILNILAALVGVSLPLFALSTIIGVIPTSVIYVMMGDSVRHDLISGHALSVATLTNPRLLLPLCLLGIIILLPNIIKFIKKNISKGR